MRRKTMNMQARVFVGWLGLCCLALARGPVRAEGDVEALERIGSDAASATSYLQRVISSNPYGDRERSLAIVKAPGKPEESFTALQKAAAAAIEAIRKPAVK